jgi:hypothetical protein
MEEGCIGATIAAAAAVAVKAEEPQAGGGPAAEVR